ncbi:MAG: dTMP kinase [Chitinivibrionales bacterium]|nr:dTMP kinase [Chitinivibrionales bacterium]
MSTRGLFITFEGIDGCGKTTQVELAYAYLTAKKGIACRKTREPGGTPLAESIRDLVLSVHNSRMHSSCETLLISAARAQHVQEVIIPALEQGITVLCDRFTDATLAYQGFGRKVNEQTLRFLNTYATEGLTIAMTFIFDIPVDAALKRLQSSGKKKDRFESNPHSFYDDVRRGYLHLASEQPQRIRLIDAQQSIEQVHAEVCASIDTLLVDSNR